MIYERMAAAVKTAAIISVTLKSSFMNLVGKTRI